MRPVLLVPERAAVAERVAVASLGFRDGLGFAIAGGVVDQLALLRPALGFYSFQIGSDCQFSGNPIALMSIPG